VASGFQRGCMQSHPLLMHANNWWSMIIKKKCYKRLPHGSRFRGGECISKCIKVKGLHSIVLLLLFEVSWVRGKPHVWDNVLSRLFMCFPGARTAVSHSPRVCHVFLFLVVSTVTGNYCLIWQESHFPSFSLHAHTLCVCTHEWIRSLVHSSQFSGLTLLRFKRHKERMAILFTSQRHFLWERMFQWWSTGVCQKLKREKVMSISW
jgi:hypothetical protein